MRKLILGLLAAAAVLIVPTTASASTTIHLGREYWSVFPSVRVVKATNLPRLTDGYAPRSLIAESVVGVIQYRASLGKGIPSRVWARGARWNGGHWRVRYRVVANRYGDQYAKFTARKGRQVLRFDAFS